LEHLGELVMKPVEGSGGYGIVFGPQATRSELKAVREKIEKDPRERMAQPLMQLATVATKIGGELPPRHVDLRPFAVNGGDGIWVLPGGLTRVATPEGSMVVNSSQGGGSKDTWVLATASSPEDKEFDADEVVLSAPLDVPESRPEPEAGVSEEQ